MKVSYYPGCALDGTAREYGESVESVMQTLGVDLAEVPDWNCCGSSSAHVTSNKLASALSANNLMIADKTGNDLMIPCAMCYQRLKIADRELLEGKEIEGVSGSYSGNIKVSHLVDFLFYDVGEKTISEKVSNPLKGLNPVAYYGCLTVRPPEVTGVINYEDPQEMDQILTALGAEVKNWSFKTECCSGSLTLPLPEIAYKLIARLLDMALEAGADCIVAACPMCQGNLDNYQHEISRETGKNYNIPIFYISELLGLAFDASSTKKWLKRHRINTRPLLTQKGLI